MELYHIIRDYGEDPFAKNIAKHIVKNRTDKPIETTFELNEIIKAAVPAKMRQNGHPSKQTFQAIRIECNHTRWIIPMQGLFFRDSKVPTASLPWNSFLEKTAIIVNAVESFSERCHGGH